MHRSLLTLALAVGLAAALLASSPKLKALAAQDVSSDSPNWELTGLAEPVLRLFTPASGAFFAQTTQALLRSDDAGATWSPVALGPATMILTVDPTNHAVLYAAGPDGVYKSSDDAASWKLVLHYGPEVGGNALALAVSPADHNLVYLGASPIPGVSSDFRFFRSRDGGATWQQLEEHHFSLCGWGVPILQPHPTAANRVFRAADCTAGRNFGESLSQSTNAGETWTASFNPQPFQTPFVGYPARLAGGQGLAPERFYLAVNRDRRQGGSSIFRSDDDGANWSEVLAYRGGGSGGYTPPGDDPNAPNVQLGGLAYDPGNPDQVYVGRQIFSGYFEPPSGGGVASSSDGGETWADLGRQDIGAVRDLALGDDGANLYAATDQGLWRLRLCDGN